ncbi:MAG: hypothetical protein ACRD9L_20960, partial [Bryobacteraceae bacterium]
MRTLGAAGAIVCAALGSSAAAQQVQLQPAQTLTFPSDTDSNSPALWSNRQLVLYNSTGIGPVRSTGSGQSHLGDLEWVVLGPSTHVPYWIEATWTDSDGNIFAWYHHEPRGICGALPLTAPQIGALVSRDGGRSFSDLGIVLESGYPVDCSAQNGYFAGGHGDFTVIQGRNLDYLYFLFSNYSGPLEAQGVAVARMPLDRRYNPFGAVEKYYEGDWLEPGVGGRVTPIFPATVAWAAANADSFWGPSVHWNTFLNKFVMLLNRSCCSPGWPQEGVYVSFNGTLSDPQGWTAPVKILDDAGWYPQVLGLGPGRTDKLAGRVARLYVYGVSSWEIVFEKEQTDSVAPANEPDTQSAN